MIVFFSAMVMTSGNCSLTSSQFQNARWICSQSAMNAMASSTTTSTAYWT